LLLKFPGQNTPGFFVGLAPKGKSKKTWLASHSHKFSEAKVRSSLIFTRFLKFFNPIFWGDGGGFSAISVIIFVLMLGR
jgi:hypothetical protein